MGGEQKQPRGALRDEPGLADWEKMPVEEIQERAYRQKGNRGWGFLGRKPRYGLGSTAENVGEKSVETKSD